jgi:Binding-protein-dependent transport system inner membrane component
MSKCDLPRDDGIGIGDVRHQVVESVLELDVHPDPKLLDVKRSIGPIDTDLLADPPSLVCAEASPTGHAARVYNARLSTPVRRARRVVSCRVVSRRAGSGQLFLAIPLLLLLILLAVIFGQSLTIPIYVVGFTAWLVPARLIRGETLSLRVREYVMAVRIMGAERLKRPRVESNHRTQLRRLPLCPLSYGAARVADGIRTRDHRDHNPGLYQLSYRHQAPTSYRRASPSQNLCADLRRCAREDSNLRPSA